MKEVFVNKKLKNYYLNIFKTEILNKLNDNNTEFEWVVTLSDDLKFMSTQVKNNIHLVVRNNKRFKLEFFVYNIISKVDVNGIPFNEVDYHIHKIDDIHMFTFSKNYITIPIFYRNFMKLYKKTKSKNIVNYEFEFYKKSPLKYQRNFKIKKLNIF